MNSRPLLFVALTSAAVLGLAGCGKSVSDRAAEAMVSAATGGKVQVSKSGDQVTYKTPQGEAKISTGGDLSIPPGFPSDVHLPTGSYKVTNVIQLGPSTVVTLHSSQQAAALFAEYDTSMKSAGWTEAMAMQSAQSASMLSFQKDKRVVTVTMEAKPGSSDGGTDITLQHAVQQKGG
jgi:hypothetical protein